MTSGETGTRRVLACRR